jgi:diguanylate cyclase (GGDEF)-like protein/PAS domain S-box-containing protein
VAPTVNRRDGPPIGTAVTATPGNEVHRPARAPFAAPGSGASVPIDAVAVPIVVVERGAVGANASAVALLGGAVGSRSALLARIHPNDRSRVAAEIDALATGGAPVVLDVRLTDGARSVRVSMVPHGEAVVCSIERTGVLAVASSSVRLALESVSEGLLFVDPTGRIVDANEVAGDVIGLEANRLLGRRVAEVFQRAASVDGTPLETVLPVFEVLAGREPQGSVEFTLVVGAATRWLAMSALPIPGGSMGAVCVLEDLSERRAAQGDLEFLAYHDALTGLPNRRMLLDQLERLLTLSARHGTPVSAVVFDLDGFKAVNDTYGHAAGDELLQLLSERLQRELRSSDQLARLGGDEFAVLVDHHDDVTALADRLLRLIAQPVELRAATVAVGASIGISSCVGRLDPARLLHEADTAMYEVKASGKGGWAVYDPERHEHASRRAEWRQEIERALVDDEFFLDYQPIVDLAARRMLGVEALLRWQHPERGVVMPGAFVGLAEQTGQIVPVGRWVLRRSLGDLAAWIRDGRVGSDFYLTVNVSPQQLLAADYLEDLVAALAEHGLAGKRLVLEVTEGAAMARMAGTQEVLSHLRAHGVGLALDDYGSVHASITYLRQLPFTVLKVDRSLVSALSPGGDGPGDSLIRSIVDVSSLLGLGVLAEGVEETWQCERLVELGCSAGQGYLFGQPGEAEAILDRWDGVAATSGRRQGVG